MFTGAEDSVLRKNEEEPSLRLFTDFWAMRKSGMCIPMSATIGAGIVALIIKTFVG